MQRNACLCRLIHRKINKNNIDNMKKVFLALVLASQVMLTSCVTSCLPVRAEQALPLASHHIELRNDFGKVTNNVAVDVEFTQGESVSATLICPTELKDYVVFKIEENQLTLQLSEDLDRQERSDVNNVLGKSRSKLLLSAPKLTNISVRGSSTFSIMNDLRTSSLSAELSGSGDIRFNGVQSDDAVVAVVNGSGDVEFGREIKAKRVELSVNGSGDVKADIVTAHSVSCVVNGSGDMELKNVSAVETSFGVNGSGDLMTVSLVCEKVKASVNGSGDLMLSGSCDSASLNLTSSGDLVAEGLEAKSVTVGLVGSGTVSCNAEQTLSASVTGSGEVKYRGNPAVSTTSPKKVRTM